MRITVDVDDKLERIARAAAGAERKSLSAVINEALTSHLPNTQAGSFLKLIKVPPKFIKLRINKPMKLKVKQSV